jgi:hypothetical protein
MWVSWVPWGNCQYNASNASFQILSWGKEPSPQPLPRLGGTLCWARHCGQHKHFLLLKARRSWVWFLISLDFAIDLILLVTLWLWVWLSLQHKWEPGIFVVVKGSRRVKLTTSPPSMNRWSRQMWEPRCLATYGPSHPVTGTALSLTSARKPILIPHTSSM